VKLCECGCGKPTALARFTNRQYGHVKGQPVRFVPGHHMKVVSREREALVAKGLIVAPHGPGNAAAVTRWKLKNIAKTRAHATVKRALYSGALVRPNACEQCGQSGIRAQAHHEDYDRPLDVTWLCIICHRRRHTRRAA
jgi:hypothetical protein